MDALSKALFEDPTWIYVALALVEVVLVMLWRAQPKRVATITLIVPVVLAVAVFIVSAEVVTDRERITAAARAIAEEVEAGRLDVLSEHLDSGYRGYGGTKLRALAICRTEIARYRPRVVTCRRLEVELAGQEARLRATTLIVPGHSGPGHVGGRLVDWDIRWAKRPEGWRIVEAAAPIVR